MAAEESADIDRILKEKGKGAKKKYLCSWMDGAEPQWVNGAHLQGTEGAACVQSIFEFQGLDCCHVDSSFLKHSARGVARGRGT